MKKILLFILGAVVMEILAMEVKIMHLPSSASTYFGIFAALLVFIALWEKPIPDERDRMLAWRSSHYSFLTVTTVLTGILIYQTISRAVEPWMLAAVASLVISKLIGRFIISHH